MNKWWSVLFGAMVVASVGLFIAAPFVGWWLPKNVSSFGGDVDFLFYLILVITGFFFVLTEGLLVYFLYVYAGGPGAKEHLVGHHYAEQKVFWTTFFKRIARPVSRILHNQHRVEMAWTLVPAIILLYIAFAQITTWQDIKDPANMPPPKLVMEVSARMFEWRVRYPGTPLPKLGADTEDTEKTRAARAWQWANHPEMDDVHVVNEVHVWKDAPVRVFLKTKDVIHSLYFPNLRLKQDALPGKTIPVWFMATDYNTTRNEKGDWEDGYNPETGKFGDTHQIWELACAELCGWGHYKMQGKLFVHKDKDDYLEWLRSAREKQFSTQSQPEAINPGTRED